MAKPLEALVSDLKRAIESARADAGPVIIRSLVEDGPWWTSNFGASWELSGQPLRPTRERKESPWAEDMPRSKNQPNVVALRLPLNSPLYIGNVAAYAGFAVNNPNAKLRGDTYADHGRKYKLTAVNRNPNWFNVYTAHDENAEIIRDLTKAFVGRGFRPRTV